MLKIGIIGAGRLGSFHADKAATNSEVELVGVADPIETNRKSIAEKHGIRCFATNDELLSLVDAVIVAAPTYLHFDIGMECLKRGRHLLMEKPMCTSRKDAEKLIAAAKQSRVVFQVGHVEAFNPAWEFVQDVLEDAKAGKPIFIDATRNSGYTFRSTDVGTVFDMMIHDIDLVLSLIPSAVSSVQAVGFNVIGGPHEDIASTQIRFENGSLVNLFSSRVAQSPKRTMQITLPTRSVFIDFATRQSTIISPTSAVQRGEFAPDRLSQEQVAKQAPTFMSTQFTTETVQRDAVDALAAELDDFVQAIQSGRHSRVSADRALAAVILAEEIVQAIKISFIAS
ncbi:MAG: Gfo/Idh/MocA family oxidoreductase [Thermoguttaceae bacterium]